MGVPINFFAWPLVLLVFHSTPSWRGGGWAERFTPLPVGLVIQAGSVRAGSMGRIRGWGWMCGAAVQWGCALPFVPELGTNVGSID
jgi:hypothetical protein